MESIVAKLGTENTEHGYAVLTNVELRVTGQCLHFEKGKKTPQTVSVSEGIPLKQINKVELRIKKSKLSGIALVGLLICIEVILSLFWTIFLQFLGSTAFFYWLGGNIVAIIILFNKFQNRGKTYLIIYFGDNNLAVEQSWFAKDEMKTFKGYLDGILQQYSTDSKQIIDTVDIEKHREQHEIKTFKNHVSTPDGAPSSTLVLLHKYMKLKEDGTISDEEFQKIKTNLIYGDNKR